MGKRRFGAIAVFVATLVLVPVSAFAQGTTGTLRGKVTDAATGAPMAAVNVVLLETSGDPTAMGAFTNAEGEYVIINVRPGRYHIQATFVGFGTTTYENLLVTVGVSTIQNFALEQRVLDVGETIVVQAERELIQRDVTGTQQSYTIEEMERMAVSNTTEIMALQTNVYQAYQETEDIYQYYERGQAVMYMRGGRNAEVAFMIDGMQVTNLLYGGQAATVSPFSLSEMVVMAGGMSAEFGNAMSGVVNMVTREGGNQYDANFEVTSSEISGAPIDDVLDMTSMQGYVGGPIPYVARTTFFLSGSATTQRSRAQLRDHRIFDLYADPTDPDWVPNPNIDYYDVPTMVDPDDPGLLTEDWGAFDPDEHDIYMQRWDDIQNLRVHALDTHSGYLGYGYDDPWNFMLNMTHRLTPSMKLNLSGSVNGTWSMPYRHNSRFSSFMGIPQRIQDNAVWGTPRYDTPVDVDGNPIIDEIGDVVPGTGLSGFINEKERLFTDNRRYAMVWTHQINQSTFYSARASYYRYFRDSFSMRYVNDWGWAQAFNHRYDPDYFDVLDVERPRAGEQVYDINDPMHLVTLVGRDTRVPRVGMSLPPTVPYNENYYYDRVYGWVSDRGSAGLGADGSGLWDQTQNDLTRTLKADITSQISTHHQVKAGLLYNSLTITNRTTEAPWLSNPFQNADYRKSPWEMGIYIQDKVEYDFMILNLGLRYDSGKAGDVGWWVSPYDPVNPDTGELVLFPQNTDPANGAVAPLKVSKLRSVLSPRIGVSHPVTDRAVVYFNYGHFYQTPQYDHQFFPDNLLGTGPPLIGNPNLDNEKTVAYEFGLKNQFSEIYAVEVTLWAKDSSNLVSTLQIPPFFNGVLNPYRYMVFLNYDYAASRGVDLSFVRRYANFFSGRIAYSFMTGESNREEPWSGYWGRDELDTQPKRSAPLSWQQPHSVTANFTVQIPEGIGPEVFGFRPLEETSASIIYRATAGRPYTPTTRERNLERNSGRRPWQFRWDLRLYRDFQVAGVRASLFGDVRNLLDRKNVASVFSRTGKPDDPGPDATSYSDNYDNFHYYGTPRTINVGLRIFF